MNIIKKVYLLFKRNCMSKKLYTQEEIGILKTNKYVKNCSKKYITFTDEIKIKALKLYDK